MKFFVAFVALVAVAVASPVNKPQMYEDAKLEAIIAAIQSPNTDPATAIILEQHLMELLGATSPIDVGPAIVETPILPPGIAIQPPGIIIEPTPDVAIHPTPVIIDPSPVVIDPSPVLVVPGPVAAPETSSVPLVQIILNINQEQASGVPPVIADVPIVPGPIIVPTPVLPEVDHEIILPTPVLPGVNPEIVLPTPVLPGVNPEIVLPTPVVPEIVPEPVIIPEPVIVGTPVLPTPVINLPEILN